MSLAREREISAVCSADPETISLLFGYYFITGTLRGEMPTADILSVGAASTSGNFSTLLHLSSLDGSLRLRYAITSFTFSAQETFSNSLLMRIKSLVSDVACRCRIARLMAKKLPVRRRVL